MNSKIGWFVDEHLLFGKGGIFRFHVLNRPSHMLFDGPAKGKRESVKQQYTAVFGSRNIMKHKTTYNHHRLYHILKKSHPTSIPQFFKFFFFPRRSFQISLEHFEIRPFCEVSFGSGQTCCGRRWAFGHWQLGGSWEVLKSIDFGSLELGSWKIHHFDEEFDGGFHGRCCVSFLEGYPIYGNNKQS